MKVETEVRVELTVNIHHEGGDVDVVEKEVEDEISKLTSSYFDKTEDEPELLLTEWTTTINGGTILCDVEEVWLGCPKEE